MADPTDFPTLLKNVQGNVLAPFSKDHQRLMLLEMTDQAGGVAWLHAMSGEVATSDEVRRFNDLFRDVRARRAEHREVVQAVWTQLLLSAQGLTFLGVTAADIQQLGPAFAGGMKSQAAALGDTNESDPSTWREPYRSCTIHAMLIVAADARDDLDEEVDFVMALAQDHGLCLIGEERGNVLRGPLRGHEHFGFKDGISQPLIAGLDVADPNQPAPVQAGEFVLGYDAPFALAAIPTWAEDGSLIAFRRLRQDVPDFQSLVAQVAQQTGLDPGLVGAKLMGRWPSGAPLAQAPEQDDPAIAADDTTNNDFDYGGDPDGDTTPRFGHIRKANPRSEQPIPPDGEAQKRRILRRGVPFGPQAAPTNAATEPHDRGLLFFCAQSNIEQQFQFIQQSWANDGNFPTGPGQPVGGYNPTPGSAADGPDPIIGQHHGQGQDNLKRAGVADVLLSLVHQLVTTTGGEYFFAPSISTLAQWGQVPTPPAPDPTPSA